MKEYIDREAVMQAFSDYVWNSNHSDLVPAPQWNHAVEIVRDSPAADVVEVVRCRECKHCFVDGDNVRFNLCLLNHNKVQSDDWYCADGERKGGDE